MKRIASDLNTDDITSPGGGTWDASAVRYILLNEVYRGWRIWNKTKNIRKPDGKKTYRNRPQEKWTIMEDAHPAIVDDELWAATKRRQTVSALHSRITYGNPNPPAGVLPLPQTYRPKHRRRLAGAQAPGEHSA